MHTPEPLPDIFPIVPQVLFTDVDDTLTLDGALPVATFSALDELRRAGIAVVPVTGASSGWCDCMVRTWPVDTVIGENGAFIMRLPHGGRLEQSFIDDEVTRQRNREVLDLLVRDVLAAVPEARLTLDSRYRLTDVAFDIGQEQRVSRQAVDQILECCRSRGVNARASSIHINVWIGGYSKATTAAALLRRLAVPLDAAVFIGDSPNDESMFGLLDSSVGVSNIAPFLGELHHCPAYITRLPGGLGFAELTGALLRAREAGRR